MFDHVTDIQVDMGPYWNADPWIEHINKENVLKILDAQWLSASSLAFYIRYLCEVFLSKIPRWHPSSLLAKCLLQHVDKTTYFLCLIMFPTENIYFMDPAPVTDPTNYKNVKALVETLCYEYVSFSLWEEVHCDDV